MVLLLYQGNDQITLGQIQEYEKQETPLVCLIKEV